MNVLVLMCDHHRFDALSCLGNPLARTPNLDRLAARSVRFDNAFTQSPVCAPARHSLATGRYAHAQGVITNSHKPHAGMVTIAHALQPLGYRRLQQGHMHWTDPEADTGYEPWLTHAAWHDAMPREVVARYEWEGQSVTRRTTAGPSPRTREQYSGHFVAANAIGQIEEAVERGEKFLCWSAFSEPHPPFYPPRDIYERYDQSQIELPAQAPPDAPPPHETVLKKREEWAHLTEVELRQMLAGYYGMVELVDGYIGMVLEAVERLGIGDETIIVWTTDHGDQMWEHELFLKFQMHEASVHVPLLMYDPRRGPGVRSELVEHIDLFPTIYELIGAECPDTVQGRSLVPLLGEEAGALRSCRPCCRAARLLDDEGEGQAKAGAGRAARLLGDEGEGQAKAGAGRAAPLLGDEGEGQDEAPEGWRDAVFSQIGDVQMIRTKEWKLNVYDGEPGDLYDLEKDPEEFYNRVADAEYADTVQSLHERLRDWEQSSSG